MNKIKSSIPKSSLINNIVNPPNDPIKFTLANADSGANIHLENQATPTMTLVTMSKYIIARLPG